MLFNSFEYLLFLPIVFAIYWLLRNHLKLQNLFVVLASYVFYGWWDWRFLILIAFTSLCSYASGILIERGTQKHGIPQSPTSDSPSIDLQSAREQAPGQTTAQSSTADTLPDTSQKHASLTKNIKNINSAKAWMITNIVINLGILAVFKYYDFFVSEFGALFEISTESLLLRIILPVGISFYTFQALSYSIDVYRGNIKPTKDIIAFFAFISFFPQLVAGPIERATNLLSQFLQKRTFMYEQGVDGMRQILWGLFKKIAIADNCAMYVDQAWATYDTQSGSTLLLAAILFTFQIYGDFSGYSDIAIGTAKLFGIKLMRNFNNPYFSRDIAEFWRRWHISLTTWFRDYVYIPLSGSRPIIGKENNIENTYKNIENRLDLIKKEESTVADSNPQSTAPYSAHEQAPGQTNDPLLATDADTHHLSDSLQKNGFSILTKKPKNVFSAYINNIELRKKLMVVRNVMVVFLICGLWHGANWTYLVWGLYNVLLFLPLILLGKSKRYKDVPLVWKQLPQMLLTFVLVTIGWIIFRAPSLPEAWDVCCNICSGTLWSAPYVLPMQEMAFIATGILVMIGVEWLQRNEAHGLVLNRMTSRVLRYAIYIVLITMILWKGESGDAFIYFQF